MCQSKGFATVHKKYELACKLNKTLSGLKHTPIAWFDKLKVVLVDCGFSYRHQSF